MQKLGGTRCVASAVLACFVWNNYADKVTLDGGNRERRLAVARSCHEGVWLYQWSWAIHACLRASISCRGRLGRAENPCQEKQM